MPEAPRASVAPFLLNLSSDITAQYLLGKIRFPGDTGEPRTLFALRMICNQFRTALGEENYQKFFADLKPALHALADCLLDAVTGTRSAKAKAAMMDLEIPVRVAVEQVVASLTGKTESSRSPYWDDNLWAIKRSVDHICASSISGITPVMIRDGYSGFVHAVVDQLYEHRDTLIN